MCADLSTADRARGLPKMLSHPEEKLCLGLKEWNFTNCWVERVTNVDDNWAEKLVRYATGVWFGSPLLGDSSWPSLSIRRGFPEISVHDENVIFQREGLERTGIVGDTLVERRVGHVRGILIANRNGISLHA